MLGLSFMVDGLALMAERATTGHDANRLAPRGQDWRDPSCLFISMAERVHARGCALTNPSGTEPPGPLEAQPRNH